ncbi:MAG: isochorismatase [Planctomycetaceae bacterium]|nr:isochorismatase [Planctomycetaceae bacterium]
MKTAPYLRSPELLSASSSRLVVVDVQERLLPAIPVADALIDNCRTLIRGAQVLDVPVAAIEQYPKGLGPTTPAVAELLDEIPEKLRFSCGETLQFPDDDRYQLVVCGIEAHVCVQQTVLDFLSQGYRVYVPADVVASRAQLDRQFALDRMTSSGAIITTLESILFEWCEIAGTKSFKQISQLVKDRDVRQPPEAR